MKGVFLLGALALGVAFEHVPLATQQSAPARTPGTAVIVGRVVDADSGASVPGAVVELAVSPVRSGSGGDSITFNNVQAQGGFITIGTSADATTRVLTGADGQFAFRNVPAGRGDFTVTAQGYLGGAYHQLRPDGQGQPLEIADGQRIPDVVLKMWRNGAISGRITDEAGDPVVGARVQVMRRAAVSGQWVLIVGAQSHQTDDRGMYRVAGLLPGDYLVNVPITGVTTLVSSLDVTDQIRQANPGPNGRGAQAAGMVLQSGQLVGDALVGTPRGRLGNPDALAPVVASDGRMTAYATTFYPAASISSRATVVTLKSGEEKSGIDIPLLSGRAFRISGSIADVDGSPVANLAIHLLPVDEQNNADSAAEDAATTVSGPRGEFAMMGVPAGQYVLTVLRSPPNAAGRAGGRGVAAAPAAPSAPMPQTAWARQPVAVAENDVTNLVVALHPAISVTGRVVFDGSAPQPAGPQLQRGIRAQPTSQGLRPGGRGGGGGAPAMVVAQLAADGTFTMTGLTPGTYQLVAPGWPLLKWAPKSILAAGRDVGDATIDLDADLSNVVVTFTDRPGALAGTVRRASGELDPAALVVGFPTDPRAPNGSGMHTFTARVEANGTYTAPALAPGDYNVVAIPDVLAQNWQEPAILQKLIPLAIRVRVEDGVHVTQDVTTSVVR